MIYSQSNIFKLTKDPNGTIVAEFAYDALGRRIEKKDLVDPNNTRRYYYNYNWQALCQYDGSGALKETFVYGNYIDEVLFKVPLFYMHDHLYSPVALAHWLGSVLERYEYDAYGNCYVMDASYNPRTKSSYGNPFYFTGRELDIFDSGNLKLYNYRHRYYDSYTGRFTTNDPLGITPNAPKPNVFEILKQYEDGLNLYFALEGNPVNNTDTYGLTSCEICGPDVTWELVSVTNRIVTEYDNMPDDDTRKRHCDALYDKSTRGNAWDINELHKRRWISKQFSCCATKPRCEDTVEVKGKCYHASDVNFLMWGVVNKLCGKSWIVAEIAIRMHKSQKKSGRPNPETLGWAKFGYDHLADWPSHPLPVSAHLNCETDRCFDFYPGTAVPFFTFIWMELGEERERDVF